MKDVSASLKSLCFNKVQNLGTSWSNSKCKNKSGISKFTCLLSQRKQTFVGYRTTLCWLINVSVKRIINSYILFMFVNWKLLFICFIPEIGSFKNGWLLLQDSKLEYFNWVLNLTTSPNNSRENKNHTKVNLKLPRCSPYLKMVYFKFKFNLRAPLSRPCWKAAIQIHCYV